MSTDLFTLETTQSPYIPQQLPAIYRQNAPMFIAFLQAYYTWLGLDGNIGVKTQTLMLNRDIDTTLPEFLTHFETKYLEGIPLSNFSDIEVRLLVKNIKSIIALKGTTDGIKYLFNALYGEPVNVYRPGNDLFKTSDGVWNEEQYVEVSYSPILRNVEGRIITGVKSGATAYVYRYEQRMLPKNKSSYLLYISDVSGTFLASEAVKFSGMQMDVNNTPYIIGSLGGIAIYQGGIDFNIGDNLMVFLDPSESSPAINAVGVVSSVENKSGIVNFSIVAGGVGYVNTTTDTLGFTDQSIIITQSNTNPGAGATFQVGQLSNTFNVTCCNDFISTYEATLLNASSYGFPADPSANISTTLEVAWNIATIEVGTIAQLASVNPGAGYTSQITATVSNPVIVSLHLLDDNNQPGGTDANIAGFASIGSGAISNVTIKNSGIGYVAGEHLGLESANNIGVFANGIAQIVGVGSGFGKWKNTQGFLDYDKYLQDSHYYQNFSYEIQSALSPDQYFNIIKNGWHVAGTQMFGRVIQNQSSSFSWQPSIEVS